MSCSSGCSVPPPRILTARPLLQLLQTIAQLSCTDGHFEEDEGKLICMTTGRWHREGPTACSGKNNP